MGEVKHFLDHLSQEPAPRIETIIKKTNRIAPPSVNKRPIPEEMCVWNWGAFVFNFIWGITNNVYLSLAILIPTAFGILLEPMRSEISSFTEIIFPYISIFFTLIIAIYLGLMGNELAWQKRHFDSDQEFITIQKEWNRAGLLYFKLFIILLVITTLASLFRS